MKKAKNKEKTGNKTNKDMDAVPFADLSLEMDNVQWAMHVFFLGKRIKICAQSVQRHCQLSIVRCLLPIDMVGKTCYITYTNTR